MDQHVEPAPPLPERREGRVDLRIAGDVEFADHAGADLLCQRPDALLAHFTLLGERDFSALRPEFLGYRPGEACVVGDADYQSALAVRNSHPACSFSSRTRVSKESLPAVRQTHHNLDALRVYGILAARGRSYRDS